MALSTGLYQYTTDTGLLYQVALPSDFATALNMTPATGSEPYLPQVVSPRYATYQSNSPLAYRQAVIGTLQALNTLPALLPVNGLTYRLISFVGETIPATVFPQLAVAAGPQGPPGTPGTPATIPVPINEGGTNNDNSGITVPAFSNFGLVGYDASKNCLTYATGNDYDPVNLQLSPDALLCSAFNVDNYTDTAGTVGQVRCFQPFGRYYNFGAIPLFQLAAFLFQGVSFAGGGNVCSFAQSAFSTYAAIIFDDTGLANTASVNGLTVPTCANKTGLVVVAGW